MDKLLKMEFQPVFMSGHSLGKGHKSFWQNKVRPRVVPKKDPTCSICGFEAQERRLIHADEVWRFPGPPDAILAEIRPLCVYCHEAKDYGNLLLRIQCGIAAARLAGVVQEHYCKINDCSAEEFSEDYKAALEQKRKLEELYGYNCAVAVDYGEWTPPSRPPKMPSLTPQQKQRVRALYKREVPLEYDSNGDPIGGGTWERKEPIVVRDRELCTLGVAVKFLQSLPLEERDSVIGEIECEAELLDDFEPDIFEMTGVEPSDGIYAVAEVLNRMFHD